MININLVPLPLRKKSGSGVLSAMQIDLPREVLLGVGGAAIALMVIGHVLLFGVLVIKGVVLMTYKASWAKVLPDKNNIDALGNELKSLKQKMSSMTEAVSQKATGWSRRLNIISDAVGGGLWLNKITVAKNILTIEGSVVSKKQSEVVIVSAFVASLKKDAGLMSDLASLEVNSIVRTKIGVTDVVNFTVVAKLK